MSSLFMCSICSSNLCSSPWHRSSRTSRRLWSSVTCVSTPLVAAGDWRGEGPGGGTWVRGSVHGYNIHCMSTWLCGSVDQVFRFYMCSLLLNQGHRLWLESTELCISTSVHVHTLCIQDTDTMHPLCWHSDYMWGLHAEERHSHSVENYLHWIISN